MSHTIELELLARLDAELAGITDLDTVLDCILARARSYFAADAGSIYVREGERLRFAAAQGGSHTSEPGTSTTTIHHLQIDSSSLAGYVALTGDVLAIDDAYDMPKDLPCRHSKAYDEATGYRTRSILTVPLKSNDGDVIGVLQLINRLAAKGKVVPFSSEHVLASGHFAMRAALALYQARVTRSLAMRMIAMAELRDPTETGPHANRVASYATRLYDSWAAEQQIVPEKAKRNRDVLRTAAMLHDVGKVGIPDAILKKPGKLTEEEFAVIKQHTVIGAGLFGTCQSQLDHMAAEIALNHHENWDGSGYPGHLDPATGASTGRGKQGDEIPLMAQIVSVADVYDALCSPRSYKEAWTPAEAMAELQKLAGSKFSPHLVALFTQIEEQVRAIQARYPDE